MDLHPIIVHFPIALLTIYGLMELIRPKKLLNNESWFYVKSAFVIIGTIGAFFSLASGDVAAHQFADKSMRQVIEVHESLASISTTIFTILGATHILTGIDRKFKKKIDKCYEGKLEKPWKYLIKIKNIIYNTPFMWILAIAGLVAITMTGALGGALVYGPNADPIISIVYNLFF